MSLTQLKETITAQLDMSDIPDRSKMHIRNTVNDWIQSEAALAKSTRRQVEGRSGNDAVERFSCTVEGSRRIRAITALKSMLDDCGYELDGHNGIQRKPKIAVTYPTRNQQWHVLYTGVAIMTAFLLMLAYRIS
jgi:hypothetical protein